MAENDSMEGKNFALQERIMRIINNTKDQEAYISSNIDTFSIRAIQRDDDEYELILMGEKIGTAIKNKGISYNIEGLKNVKKYLENNGRPVAKYEDLGLPDIKYLEELQKEENQKLQEEQERELRKQEEDSEQSQDPEEDEKEVSEEEELEEEAQEESKGLLELNLPVLQLINPRLKGCKGVYLDPKTNSLVVKNKFGKICSPEEFGFKQKVVEGGNFALSKMDGKGKISSNENPTKLYAIDGSNYAITTDFKTHHKEANIAVKGIDENHGNSYSVIKGNLAKFDSGEISKYQGQERAGTIEGWNAGEQDKTNERAERLLEDLSPDDKKKFQKGFEDKLSDEHRMNDLEDLKEAVTEILVKKYGVYPDNASKIAYGMVYENKKMEDYGIKPKERETQEETLVPGKRNRPI